MGESFLEKYAIGWLCWLKTTLIHEPDALVSKTNGSTKLGIANTRAVVKATFKAANACSAISLHLKESFFNKLVNRATILA